jgi:glycosyltransferase involved in cell wall biosynthesis
MKILFAVHQFFPQHYTGTERIVLNLCKQMQRMGHFVTVLTYGIVETDGYKREGNCLIKRYEYQGVPVVSIKHKQIPDDVSFKIFDLELEEIIQNAIANEKFDIIHVFHPMRVGSIIRVAKRNKIPLVLSPTDLWLICPKGIAVTQKGELCTSSDNGMRCVRECYGNLWKDRLLGRYDETKEVISTANSIVSATDFLRTIFKINDFSFSNKLIGFGMDYHNVRTNSKEYTAKSEVILGFLSTLLPHKGAQVLLEAFNSAKMDNIRLKIYGDYFGEIDYFNRLKEMVKNNNKVEFLGAYKYENMSDIFSVVDMLVVPSVWWENSPLVLLSALAHNVPAIVSNVSGLTEIVKDGENGFSFEASSSESLAKVLQKVGGNPAILNEIKAKIHHPPRIEEMAFEYEKIYLSLKGIKSSK